MPNNAGFDNRKIYEEQVLPLLEQLMAICDACDLQYLLAIGYDCAIEGEQMRFGAGFFAKVEGGKASLNMAAAGLVMQDEGALAIRILQEHKAAQSALPVGRVIGAAVDGVAVDPEALFRALLLQAGEGAAPEDLH